MQRSIIAPAERVTNLRWLSAAIVGIGILLMSFDQVALAVSGGAIRSAFGVDDVGFGLLASAFGWAYLLAQIPFGVVLDRIGVKRTGLIWTAAWGVLSLVTIAANSFGLLIGLRAATGVALAPAFPTAAKATGYWFPTSERSGGSAFFETGAKLGIALGIPFMTFVVAAYGWHATFLITGVAGLLYALVFFAFYGDPSARTDLTFAEKQHLVRGGAADEGAADGVNVFGSAKLWGMVIGYAAYAFAFCLLLTWLPRYFATTFGFTAPVSASYAMVPWLVSALATFFIGGMLVDTLIKRGIDASLVRKSVLVTGMILGLAVSVATGTRDANVAVAAITVALAGLGMSSAVVWSIPSLIAPRGCTGTVAATMNCAGALAAIVAPIAAGYAVKATAGFGAVFVLATVVLLAGIAAYVLLLGKTEAPASGGIAI